MNGTETIIIVNDFGSVNGGAAQVAISSAIDLAERGYKVIYYCGVGPVDEKLKKSVDEVICLEQYDILNDPSRINAVLSGIWNKKAYVRMKDLIEKHKNNKLIIHIHGWSKCLSSSVVAACSKAGITPFITVHDYFPVCPNGGFFNYKKNIICSHKPMSLKCLMCNCDSRSYPQKLWRYLRQLVQDKWIRYNKKIIPVYISEFSRNHIEPYIKAERFAFVQNPIEVTGDYKVNAAENDTIIYIGRISPEKGVDLLCQAVHMLNLKAVIIGDGSEKEKLEKNYSSEIEFTGWKKHSEMEEYIKKARVLVFPSKWYEGAPLIVPEVQAHGVSCIVPDNCAGSEYIDDGVNGLIFKTGDVDSLAEKMEIIFNADEKSILFDTEKWRDIVITKDEHTRQLLKAYDMI